MFVLKHVEGRSVFSKPNLSLGWFLNFTDNYYRNKFFKEQSWHCQLHWQWR